MGAFDNLGRLCTAQAISATNTWSTNFIDLVSVFSQVGVGNPVYLCVRCPTATTDAADTIAIQVQNSATNDLTNLNGTIKNLYTICADALAEHAMTDVMDGADTFGAAGTWIIRMPLPYECDLRYLQLKFIQSTSNGIQYFDAWLQATPPDSSRGKGYETLVSNVGNPA
ncbi:MAG: hypothetical protein KKD00_06730 [Gammaproteobacteria bacterium]|nr:hypothetical protein [Gammaproteobacteria bacterium]